MWTCARWDHTPVMQRPVVSTSLVRTPVNVLAMQATANVTAKVRFPAYFNRAITTYIFF